MCSIYIRIEIQIDVQYLYSHWNTNRCAIFEFALKCKSMCSICIRIEIQIDVQYLYSHWNTNRCAIFVFALKYKSMCSIYIRIEIQIDVQYLNSHWSTNRCAVFVFALKYKSMCSICIRIEIQIAHLRQERHNSKFMIFQERILKVLKCYHFLWVQRRHNCSPAASFANCVMTLYLLKMHLQTFLSIPRTQKCQILSCDTLVTNERNVPSGKENNVVRTDVSLNS